MFEFPYLLWSNESDIVIFNFIGVIICVYSLYIEIKKEKDPGYRAACDFNEHMSCSRVLTSNLISHWPRPVRSQIEIQSEPERPCAPTTIIYDVITPKGSVGFTADDWLTCPSAILDFLLNGLRLPKRARRHKIY
ncbi:vitamin K epoxide reductase complex subunit 1-like [Elysia marginata]|uniref:Vitamin K epoxide reductase complex subunit 1-like n=1 Tax=Elysia marginata TaxID=1093978 RepID=A0AAV4IQH8_9GAST|nr:vitamin K epoxide reductase complex subunit 1-like [Elysia marginata]